MASEWESVSLGDVCDFRAGSVFKPALQGRSSGDFPFVKVSDMNLPANGVRIQEANNWVSEKNLRELRAKPLPPGTVVFAKIGEALRQNRLRQVVRDTIVDNNMMGAVPHLHRLDARYFYYALSQFDLFAIAQGTALPYLTISSLSALTLKLPPLEEQQAIGNVLGALDDNIETNRRMIETLEGITRMTFKSWFVDFDPVRAQVQGLDSGVPAPLTPFFPKRLEGSELGEIPEGWQVGEFADVAEQLREQVNPMATPDAIFAHHSIPAFDAELRPKFERGESIKSVKSRVPPGVVLLSKLNPEIGRVWLVDVADGDQAICSPEFLVLRARAPFTQAYVYCLTRSPHFRQQVEGLVTGTSKSHQRAQADAILGLLTVIPSSAAVSTFDRLMSPLLKRALACREEMQSLARIRDTLLPKLISGELSVRMAERSLETVV